MHKKKHKNKNTHKFVELSAKVMYYSTVFSLINVNRPIPVKTV